MCSARRRDRCLAQASRRWWAEVESQDRAGEIEIDIPARAHQATRTALAEVKFAVGTIKPPQRLTELRLDGWTPGWVWAVKVKEPHPPAGGEPLEWMVLPHVAVRNFAEAVPRVSW